MATPMRRRPTYRLNHVIVGVLLPGGPALFLAQMLQILPASIEWRDFVIAALLIICGGLAKRVGELPSPKLYERLMDRNDALTDENQRLRNENTRLAVLLEVSSRGWPGGAGYGATFGGGGGGGG